MKTRIVYFDYLKIAAIIAVVLLHSFSEVLFLFEPVRNVNWWWGNLIASATHWAVPVFFMMSGALHLGKVIKSPIQFYLHKAKRILIPLGVFILFYAFFYHFIRGDTLSIFTIFRRLIFDQPYEHLYFLIILFVLFLITPFINSVILPYPIRWSILLLLSVLYTLFIPPTRFIGLFWIPYLSYYLMGYSLQKSLFQMNKSYLLLAIVILIVATMFGTALLTTHIIPNSDGFYLFGIPSPLTFGLSICIFLLFKNYFSFSQVLNEKIAKMSEHVLGIYLVHQAFIFMLVQYFSKNMSFYILERGFIFLITTVLSFFTVYCFQTFVVSFRKKL